MRRRSVALVCGLLVTVLAGCSGRQAYDAVQHNQAMQCRELPIGQYEACMETLGPSYDAYARQRQEVMEDDPGNR